MENLFEINLSKPEIDAISNLGLAHMGDCVFEILCRAYLCARGEKTVDRLHRDTIAMVKAPAQAQFADRMLPLLTEEDDQPEIQRISDYYIRSYEELVQSETLT